MGVKRLLVDHQKLEYEGPFELKAFLTFIDRWAFERGFDRKLDKDFELDTKEGRHLEWETSHWKKMSDYAKFILRLRILVYNYRKVDAVQEDKKVRIGSGYILIYVDGYLETDYFHKWDFHPVFIFIRSLMEKFVYRAYTERFEQRLTYDMTHLYSQMERFLNVYRHYRVVKIVPHYAY
ncbi:hypothetical protein J4212_01335 [Candidatus Woesearchaeota archaeon]|nr:hypothetical protein [Candidatus Woesearchaeota archaeon]